MCLLSFPWRCLNGKARLFCAAETVNSTRSSDRLVLGARRANGASKCSRLGLRAQQAGGCEANKPITQSLSSPPPPTSGIKISTGYRVLCLRPWGAVPTLRRHSRPPVSDVCHATAKHINSYKVRTRNVLTSRKIPPPEQVMQQMKIVISG